MKIAGKGTTTAERGRLCEEGLEEDDNSWEEGTADWEQWSCGAQQQEQHL